MCWLSCGCCCRRQRWRRCRYDHPPAYPQLEDGHAQYAVFPRPLANLSGSGGRFVGNPAGAGRRGAIQCGGVGGVPAGDPAYLCGRMVHQARAQIRAWNMRRRCGNGGCATIRIPMGWRRFPSRPRCFIFWARWKRCSACGWWAWRRWRSIIHSWADFVLYVGKDRVFTEPLFVVIIMAIAASRPVLRFAEFLMSKAAALGKGTPAAWWLSVLIIAPVLGSFITEPAAMTIAALLLGRRFYPFPAAGQAGLWHARPAVCEHLGGRHAHPFRGAAGADGGRQMGLGHGRSCSSTSAGRR